MQSTCGVVETQASNRQPFPLGWNRDHNRSKFFIHNGLFKEDVIMLVLSRKEGEKIHIGSDIVVTVTSLKGGRVKLGIEAPHNVTVLRGELKSENHSTWDSPTQASYVGHLIGHP